ncbi:hypothetical protein M3Y94_00984800 [Aphelenchoides besseyi]|nr:hypothetical protein M3Y94_00984800 [Aphelenchoides besseyi]KAI6221092.1 hypothetical protein M3Y95_01004400 [Aphelenchoides besseyi]
MNILVQALGFFYTSKNEDVLSNSKPISDPDAPIDKSKLLERRKKCIGSTCQIFYAENPLVVSRATKQYIYDEGGNQLLDCISNVQHVGHCHPTVVGQIAEQMSRSNCNIRFVSSKLTDCAEAILSTLPPALDTVLFCNSGSEANDLALRLARDFTGNEDVVVLEHAYHGHLISTMQISPYKFDHGSTIQQPGWVHVAPTPDPYRGKIRLSDELLYDSNARQSNAELYAKAVGEICDAEIPTRRPAAFIAEALQSCGGQILPTPGYFKNVADEIRSRGGLMIIDEVQTAFGRVGERFWAHQLDDDNLESPPSAPFVPDILTIGKPIGNGFPISAVVTRREIADRLGGKVGYFNTYGGNPVACAAVLAVLNVLREERLVEHAREMGQRFKVALHELKDKHECIGDVRGVGLFWGIDLVVDRATREPATQLALDLCLLLRVEYGVLLNADGPHTNILKYKPPMCFNADDLTRSVQAIDQALTRLTTTRKTG